MKTAKTILIFLFLIFIISPLARPIPADSLTDKVDKLFSERLCFRNNKGWSFCL